MNQGSIAHSRIAAAAANVVVSWQAKAPEYKSAEYGLPNPALEPTCPGRPVRGVHSVGHAAQRNVRPHKTLSHAMRIEIDDLSHPQVHALLQEHLSNMFELSPPEQVFALDLTKLRAPDITFWSVWDNETLIGCGALKELSSTHGEIKSMRTPAAARGRGAGRAVLDRIISVAKQRGYSRLSLETGTHPAFEPAQNLYRSKGFTVSGPFSSYMEDEHSVFMELRLDASAV